MASRVASRLAGCGWMTPLRVQGVPATGSSHLVPVTPARKGESGWPRPCHPSEIAEYRESEFDQPRAPRCRVFFAAVRDFAFAAVRDVEVLLDPRERPVAFFASYTSGYDIPPTKMPSA